MVHNVVVVVVEEVLRHFTDITLKIKVRLLRLNQDKMISEGRIIFTTSKKVSLILTFSCNIHQNLFHHNFDHCIP